MYVYDIINVGENIVKIERITKLFNKTFKIKNLGEITFFLGLEVARNKNGIHLCQQKYMLDSFKETRMMSCACVSSTMNHSIKFSFADGEPLSDFSTYRRLIGKLM